MNTEDFTARHAKPITALFKGVAERYGVTERQFAERVAVIAVRSGEDSGSAKDFLAGIKADELCLAIACENGDGAAWEKFEAEFRHSMQGAARSLTKDDAEAEDLVQFVYGELFGLRTEGEKRISKLAHYSGRGSLGGWLRAVVYQCFIDRKRQTARFEQIEEASEFERLANNAALSGNGSLQVKLAAPDDLEDTRLARATEEAIATAFDEMPPRDRLILNYYYFDDLTLREIGLLMNVHEATISRWVAKIQREIKRKTEEILQRSYGLRRAEVGECIQIAARTELDVRRLIGDVKGIAAE
ncbi:MAG: sigma-70 family RNA polymerase sigma factor [Blastocatellia bacterium]